MAETVTTGVRPRAGQSLADCETLVANFDWSRTALGRKELWPPHLANTVSLILRSKVAIATLWGPNGVMIYNDAYAAIAGDRHPSVFGSNVCEGWPEVAEFNAAVLNNCLAGQSLSYRDIEMTLHRFQRDEQVYFDLDYSPILDEQGRPAGVLAICVETTAKVNAERWKNSERDRQKQMFEQAPGFMAMLSGPRHVFELTNEAYRQLVGNRPLLGHTVREAFPELEGTDFHEILDTVYATGEPFIGRSVELQLIRNPADKRVFLDFIYQPVMDPEGRTTGIFVHGVDVTMRHEAEVALRDEERRLRLAHRIAGVGPMEVDIASGTVYAPENFWRMWGLEPRDSAPTELLESLVIPEDSNARSSDATRKDGTAPTAVEYRIRRPDTGEIRWFSRHVEFVNGPDGAPAKMFGVVKDITERREAERRQKILAHELEHRIKNLLAMVGAIASRTLREGDLAIARDAFLQRLRAMSEAHSLLHETRWKGTSMQQVIESTLQIYPSEQLSIGGPPLVIEPRMSLTLALAVNELATNAVKYGALSTPDGRVEVSWTLAAPGNGDPAEALVWEWRESGGPEPRMTGRRGFGSFLIERVLSAEFEGRVTVEMRPDGLVCILKAPAPG